MNLSDFNEAKRFIFSDIEREIKLASLFDDDNNKSILQKLGISGGGGNYLAALALLSYTEFGGKLKYKRKHKNGNDLAADNFNLFFDDLGPRYQQFRKSGIDVYDIFRCGLVHEYYVKKSCDIYMLKNQYSTGIGLDKSGKFYLVVETYFEDLKRALNNLEKKLFGSTS